MEVENFDNTAVEMEDPEENKDETKFDPVNEPGEIQHTEKNNQSTEGASQFNTVQSATDEEVPPELTLVLIGDTNSIEIGSKNILLDHDEQVNVEKFSSKLYDLCGRHISVINMLGLQIIDTFPLNKGINAFLLLLPNGLHSNHYRAGVQWLEKAFGRGSLNYLMTVVTYESDETCESTLTDLKANSSFSEKRYHTCRRSMNDGKEIIDLLGKIDVMVSENDPRCYMKLMSDENKEQENLDNKSHEQEWIDTSVFQKNQTVNQQWTADCAANKDEKCDPLNVTTQSDKSDNSTKVGGEYKNQSEKPSYTKEKGGAVKVKEVTNESSSNVSERFIEDSDAEKDTNPTSQTVSTLTKEVDDMEKTAAKTDGECVPVNEPDDVEHSENIDNNTGKENNTQTPQSATTEKVTSDMNISGNKDEQQSGDQQYHRETKILLCRLHLQDKLQQKFTPADFLNIGPPVRLDRDTCETDLTHTFLQRLMMLDYRARYIPVRHDSPEISHSKHDTECDTGKTDKDDLDVLFSTSVDFDQSKQSHVHPMDVQMAAFHCSDSFFKQNMITKLSQCQYALPLLVPDPVTMDIDCPLWTFRQITKTWKVTQIKDNSNIVTMRSLPICKAKTPMVSFFRLGSLSVSKSQLMNTLINDRHSTFFHRNCPGSTKCRHLMDGVAEIAWYCPAGKPNDAFIDCIAFCNLHSDALLIKEQREILTDKSSVNVFLIPTLEKGDKSATVISALYKSPKPLILLIADNDYCAIKMTDGKYKMGLKDRSHSDVSEELKGIIRHILSGPHSSFQLETMAEVSGIRVDEDDTVCKKGKTAAMEIVHLFRGMDVSTIKEKFLTCQGHLWHEWCRIHKDLFHLTGNVEMEKSKKEQELIQIRQRQCTASFSEVMKLFIRNLSSFPSPDREYFLKWTKILIDDLSTDDLSKILQSYDEKWSEVIVLKKKHDKSDHMKKKLNELDEISTKLKSATFGLEHIFREMGQIYEAHASLQKQRKTGQTDWSKYPELAAELMISGHPMELMDGDAGHVPLTWINSLLDEVIKKLGDKKVFVLSVLGVQSSGKSTMLNAMFGLQFAVSAGRCTKGAFMQLVKVSEEIKKDFRFDYILVVDTEGLRALELAGEASLHRDNELATFVVGLGNMTLINIFGENPADMQDVLQIVVQAFMRMKEVKLSPSCVFVHQNVTDVAAAEKNMDGKRRLLEKLDQMAQLAAKEEVSDAKCFSDVIAFDVQKDVKYFAQLWEGSPPMAPPNPGYSESVQELKEFILSKASQSDGITLSHFKSTIQDLWNALLNENFVFCFKNTLEIAVYRKLETQYGNWTWELRSHMLIIENQHHTRIENGKLDKVELNSLYMEMSKIYERIKKDMKTYFDNDEEKEILVQWRGRFEVKIKEFHDEQVREVKRKLDEVIQQKNACKKLDDKKKEFENKLLKQSKDLAHQLKDKIQDEEQLKDQFNSVWSQLVSELTADTKPIKDINLEGDESTVLQELGVEWQLINESRGSDRYKKIAQAGDYSQYVSFTKHPDLCDTSQKCQDKTIERDTNEEEKFLKRQFMSLVKKVWKFGSTQQKGTMKLNEEHTSKRFLLYYENELIRSFIDNTEQQTIDIIKNKPVAARGYNPTYLLEVAKNVKEKVTEFESEKKYALKKEFMVDLALYMLDRSGNLLSQSQKKFKMNNDALTYLESKKTQYYNIFRSFCKGSSSAVVFGEMICEKLKSSFVEAVCNKTAIDLAREMKCNIPAFSGNRLDLERHVLKSLAEKEDFDGFITYIRRPKKQVETFIRKKVEKYIFTENKDKAQNILKKNAEDIKKLVSQALFTATETVNSHKGDIDMWVKGFSSLIRDHLKFTISCENFRDINNLDFLKEETEKGFDAITKEMRGLSLETMKEFRQKPDKILIDQLCKCCWVTCPFCAAVCTNTLENHSPYDHSVPFHRPSGIKGWHFRNTVELCINFCTTDVASDLSFYPTSNSEEAVPYKQYRTAGPKYADWRITPDESKLIFWKWFVCRFQKQLEDYYELKFEGRGEIPKEWKKHTKEEAIDSLDEM